MYARSSPYHRVISESPEAISISGEPDGGCVEHGDRLSIDCPVETAEHDGAGVEGAHSALADFTLAFLVLGVGCDGIHHDAGVGHVHRDVAGEDLKRRIR